MASPPTASRARACAPRGPRPRPGAGRPRTRPAPLSRPRSTPADDPVRPPRSGAQAAAPLRRENDLRVEPLGDPGSPGDRPVRGRSGANFQAGVGAVDAGPEVQDVAEMGGQPDTP